MCFVKVIAVDTAYVSADIQRFAVGGVESDTCHKAASAYFQIAIFVFDR